MKLAFVTGARADVTQVALAPVSPYLSPRIPFAVELASDRPYVPVEGEVCLLAGEKAVTPLREAGILPKKRTLSSLRGVRFAAPSGGAYLVTYDPYSVYVESDAAEEIAWDLRLAHRLATTGTLEPQTGSYRYVDSWLPLIARIETAYATTGRAVRVACDLETVGLSPFSADRWIVSIAFSMAAGEGEVQVFPTALDCPSPRVMQQIMWLLTSPKVAIVGCNLKFDFNWLALKWAIAPTNMVFDCVLVGSLLNENRSNSLKTLAKLFTMMGGYSTEFDRTCDKSRMDLEYAKNPGAFLRYAGGDVDATIQIQAVLEKQLLADPWLCRFYSRLLRPASRAFEAIEQRGILVDLNAYGELRHTLRTTLTTIRKETLAMLPNRLRIKYATNLSLSRAALLREYFFGSKPVGLGLKPLEYTAKGQELIRQHTKAGTIDQLDKKALAPSTAASHLREFLDHPQAGPFAANLKRMNAASKTLQTYVDGFLSHLQEDGRFHPTYALFAGKVYDDKDEDEDDAGTNTGRLSARDPAVQTIPKRTEWAKPLRRVFPAPAGYTILGADYDQGELKLVADASGDATMLQVFREGVDLHARTAAEVNAINFTDFMALRETDPERFELLRQGGKPANFGLVYRMSPEGYQRYAWNQYGIRLTLVQAERVHTAFFRLYAGVEAWHIERVDFAKRYGFVRTPLGRVRHLPLIHSPNSKVRSREERRAINSPIQGTLSDLCVWSATELEQKYAKLVKIFLTTHDDLKMYVRWEDVEEAAVVVKHVMENRPVADYGWEPKVSLAASVSVAPKTDSTLAGLIPLEKYLEAA